MSNQRQQVAVKVQRLHEDAVIPRYARDYIPFQNVMDLPMTNVAKRPKDDKFLLFLYISTHN
jgi:hypothetical protein